MTTAINRVMKPKGWASQARFMDNFWGYVFIIPNMVGFLVFTLGGITFSLSMSLTNWNLLRGFDRAEFIGLQNFARLFTSLDFWICLRNNLFLLLSVPFSIVIAIIIASILNQSVWGKSGVRAMFFLPYITNVVAVSTVWRALFPPSAGPINMLFRSLGVPAESLPTWLSSSRWFLPAVMIIIIWQNLGYYILMYTAGLQNIPQDYYEAVSVDGGNALHKFWFITIPMLTPVTFVVAILGVISSLQMWLLVQVLTPGGRGFGTAAYTLSYYIYRSAFVDYRTGYAAALSWVLCFLTLSITLVQWIGQKKWVVNY